MPMILTAPAFAHGTVIPPRFTCDGLDISPELRWSGSPAATQSLALIISDPDAPDPRAPKMTWIHWVLYNLTPESTGLPEAVDIGNLPPGTREGLNDWGRTGYGGPCPPVGRHRYLHKLYALDTVLPDLDKPTAKTLARAMQGHILAEVELIGTYQRGD